MDGLRRGKGYRDVPGRCVKWSPDEGFPRDRGMGFDTERVDPDPYRGFSWIGREEWSCLHFGPETRRSVHRFVSSGRRRRSGCIQEPIGSFVQLGVLSTHDPVFTGPLPFCVILMSLLPSPVSVSRVGSRCTWNDP